MLASTFIQRLKNNLFQNTANDHYDDDDWIYHINRNLEFIFLFLNVKDTWYHSRYEETITEDVTESKLYKMTYNSHGVIREIEDDDHNNRYTGVIGGENTNLEYQHFFTDTEADTFTYRGNLTGVRYIETSKSRATIKVRYKRGPILLTSESTGNDIDCPEELLGVLHDLCMWRAMPLYLEQGIALSREYLSMANETMKAYASSLGHDVPDSFRPG